MSPEEIQAAEAHDVRMHELDDLEAVLSSPAGRRFVWRLLEQSGVFRQVFSGEETHRMAFMDGNRVHGLRIFADVHEACPERYLEMVREAAAPVGQAEMT